MNQNSMKKIKIRKSKNKVKALHHNRMSINAEEINGIRKALFHTITVLTQV